VLVFLHLAPTAYSPLRDPVSAYSVGRFAWGYRAQVLLAAAAAAVLAAELPRREAILLSVFAAARVAIAFAPIGTKAHVPLAAVAFVAVCAAELWRGGERPLGDAALAGLVLTGARAPLLGVWERIFYAATIAWFFVEAVRLH